MTEKIPIGGGEAVYMRPSGEGAQCEIHEWPDDDLPKRLFEAMRERHGKGGINVCPECIERARRVAHAAIEER